MNWIKKTFALLFGAVFSLAFAIPCFSKAETVTAATETGFRFNSTNTYKMERLLTQTPLSYEASFKLTASEAATGNGYFLGNYTNPQNGAIITFRIGTDGAPILYLRQYDSTYDYWMKFGDVNVATGQKVHLAITTDKTNFYCYVNGTLKQTLQKDAGKMEIDTTFPFKVPMRVGGDDQSGESQYFKGELYSLSLFADTRTASEVSTDVSSLNTTDEHLMAAYDFTGTTQNQSKILDLSKNKFHLYNVSTEWEWSTTSKYDPNDYAFSFMVVGDTQTVMRRNEIDKANGVIQEGNTYMDKIYDYIVDNVQKKKVKHVMGLGDITDFNAKNEWDEAKRVTEKMDGVVPYSLVRGNHDLATNWFANDVLKRSPDVEPYFVYDYVGGGVGSPNNGTVDTAKCDRYFATYFSMNSSYGQQVAYCYNSSTNNTIHFFTGTDNLEYMVVALDYGPTDAMLNWASNIIQQYPNHNVIVTTHGYMWADGSHIVYSTTGGMSANFGENGNAANCGDDLWNEFLSKHANISMLICGHVDTPTIVYRKDQGINGNVVTQMLCDPQGMDANNYNQPLVQKYGDSAANRLVGMVATYYVTADGKNIDVEWYSPIQEAYYSNKGQFSVSVDAIQYPTYSFTVNNDAAKGTLTPQEPFKSAYKAGTQVRFTLDVIGNNRVQDIRFNGSTLTAINGVYTVTIGETNNVLDVLYYDIEPEPTYPLTVTNDPNKGTISPTISNSSYESGTTLSFGITTTEGYSVQQVLFNGVVVSPVGGFYTVTIAPLDNVLTIIYAHEGAGVAPESPPAEPEPPTPTLYSLSVSNNEDFGSLSFENPMQNAYEEGTTISFTIEPEEGYGIYEVLFNGEELVEENGVYTFTIVSTGNLLEIDYEELEPEDDPPQSSSSTSSSTTEDGGCSSTVSGSWLCGVAFIGAAMLLKKTKRKE